jgi:hypothetical protein
MRPQPFRARFIPRSQKIKAVFEQAAMEAIERLRVYDGETKVYLMDFFANDEVYSKK